MTLKGEIMNREIKKYKLISKMEKPVLAFCLLYIVVSIIRFKHFTTIDFIVMLFLFLFYRSIKEQKEKTERNLFGLLLSNNYITVSTEETLLYTKEEIEEKANKGENLVFYLNIEIGEVFDKKLKRIILAKDFLKNAPDVKEIKKVKTKISFHKFDFKNQDIINKIGKKYQKLEIHIERN